MNSLIIVISSLGIKKQKRFVAKLTNQTIFENKYKNGLRQDQISEKRRLHTDMLISVRGLVGLPGLKGLSLLYTRNVLTSLLLL